MHAYRSGKYPISPKAWRKLEQAERAAGLHQADAPQESGITLRETEVNYRHGGNPKKLDPYTQTESLQKLDDLARQVEAMRSELFPPSLISGFAELRKLMPIIEANMKAAGAWPASPEDGKLTPGQLLSKYQPKNEP